MIKRYTNLRLLYLLTYFTLVPGHDSKTPVFIARRYIARYILY